MTHLPIAIDERRSQCRVDVVTVERCKCKHRASAHRRLVGAARQNCGESTLVANRAERGHACFAHERIVVFGTERDETEQHVVADVLMLAARPRGNLYNGGIDIVQQLDQRHRRVVRGHLGRSTANRPRRIGEADLQLIDSKRTKSVQGTEGCTAHCRIWIVETLAGGVRVAGMTREGHDSPTLRSRLSWRAAHRFNMSDNVVTIHDTPTANTIATSVPASTDSMLALNNAQSRFQIGVR